MCMATGVGGANTWVSAPISARGKHAGSKTNVVVRLQHGEVRVLLLSNTRAYCTLLSLLPHAGNVEELVRQQRGSGSGEQCFQE